MKDSVTHENDGKALAGFGAPRDQEEEGPVRTGLTAGRVVRGILRIGFALAALWIAAVILLGLAYLVVPPVSSLMIGRIVTGRPAERTFVSLDAISPLLPAAVIASEDARFCQHAGVDWHALREVVEDAGEDGPSRGASTIPMQVAKNLFLWPSRSYIRKGLEIPVALYLDLIWSKRRMMEVYLNIAEWGEGVFGAEAAAQKYFGKSARNLNAREAALLARALPNPLVRNPARPRPGHRALAGQLQVRMVRAAPFTDCLKP
jgi:monofunctional biosynthetic peptidoglycan transglycosylase